jgi:hypothetical protein
MPFDDGTTLDLPNSFAIAMDPALVKQAWEKCGYYPATWASLLSAKLWHEMFVNNDGNADDGNDPCSSLLQQMEIQNAQVFYELKERGFALAENLKRSVNQVSVAWQDGQCVVTHQNTKAHRLKLMWISHAGEWFKQTNGGLPMNDDDDAIMALEMQCLSQVAEWLEKKKKTVTSAWEQGESASAVLEAKGNNPCSTLAIQILYLKTNTNLNLMFNARRYSDVISYSCSDTHITVTRACDWWDISNYTSDKLAVLYL